MNLSPPLVWDILLVAVMAVTVWYSYRMGLLAALFNLLGTAAAFVLSAWASKPGAAWLYDRFVQQRMVEAVSRQIEDFSASLGGLSPDSLGGLADLGPVRQALLPALANMLEEAIPGLDFFSRQSSMDTANAVLDQVGAGTQLAQAIVRTAVEPVVTSILGIAVFFVLFTLAALAVRLLVKLGRGVNHIPLVGGLNRLAGLALGLLYAGLLAYALSLGLALAAGLSAGRIPWLTTGILEETILISRLIALRLF